MPSCPTPNRAITPPDGSASYNGPEYGRAPTTTAKACDSRMAAARSASPPGAGRHSSSEAAENVGSAFRYSISLTSTRGFDIVAENLASWRRRDPAHRHKRSTRAFVRSLQSPRHDDGARCDHVPGSRRDLRHEARRRSRSEPESDSDGVRLQRVLRRLRAVRDSDRLVGRSSWHAVGPDANRLLVVLVHGPDGLGVQLLLARRHSFSLWQRRGGCVAERHAHVLTLVSAAGARYGARHLLHERAPRRRADADARDRAARVHELAAAVRALRIDWIHLVV